MNNVEIPALLHSDDYARAERLLQSNLAAAVGIRSRATPTSIPGTERFVYLQTNAQGSRFMIVDPTRRTIAPAFDHMHTARELESHLGFPIDAAALPVTTLDFHEHGVIGLHVGGRRFRLAPPDGALSLDHHGSVAMTELPSPDGRWAAFVRDHNLYFRCLRSGSLRQITFDGAAARSYCAYPDEMAWSHEWDAIGVHLPPAGVWSPDSRHFLTHALNQSDVGQLAWTQSVMPDGARPRTRYKHYPLPGDPHLARSDVIVVAAESGAVTRTEATDLQTAYMPLEMNRRLAFSEDGRRAFAIRCARFDRRAELLEIDLGTGGTRILLEESSATHLQLHPLMTGNNARIDGRTVLWWSERSGWGHLYRYDLDTGRMRNAVTSGEWLVHTVLALDEAAGSVWFLGSGREVGDPYRQRLYRASLEGGEPHLIDTEDAHHIVTTVASGRYFIDSYSTITDPGRTVLRDRSGEVLLELNRLDGDQLSAQGFRPPQRLPLLAADGVTQIWANVFLPSHTVSGQTYPVLDDCYPGPQITRAPPSIGAGFGFFGFGDAAALASIGFIVVQIDGRGTPGRSKAFQDHSYGAIQRSSDLEDHAAAIRQLAQRFPLDLDRIGIFGESGGGYASARALLQMPNFYKVAVAVSGNHDQRLLAAIWGETFHGPPGEVDYVEQANATHAARFKGKLLLIHGELDDNVSAAHTMRLVDALIQENADFEMLIIPNAGHAFIGRQGFVVRKRWDFLVRHLLGLEPPLFKFGEPAPAMWF